MLTFVEEGHLYHWNGIPVPGVSEIIDSILGDEFPDTATVERAAARGTETHHTIALALRDDLDEASVDPQVAPRLAAARLFCREMGFKPDEVETPRYSERFGFAGTLDFLRLTPSIVVDWKNSATKSKRWPLRTAAYAILAGDRSDTKRMCVMLRDDGTYRIDNHPDNSKDRRDFLTILEAFQIKQERSK